MANFEPLLMSGQDAEAIRQHFQRDQHDKNKNLTGAKHKDLLCQSIYELQNSLDPLLAQEMVIPGQGEAGGYEHNCHKQNYIQMDKAATLWMVTEDIGYANFIIKMLLAYSELYPKLPFHVSRDSNPPGKLFHQTLNENMWLLYASIAYSTVKSQLTQEQKQTIESNLLRPMVEMFTVTYKEDFDIIHNHGLWAVAAVGISGYALEDQNIVDTALYGLKRDRVSGGFLAQLDQLFSPDGYYMEGPYYHRFALRPIMLFAEAINRRQPELEIYKFNDQVIRRTTFALMSTAFPNGRLPALNDASKSMDINDEGILIATSLCFQHYQQHAQLIAMAQHQGQIWISRAGLDLAIAESDRQHKALFNWGSVVLNDGAVGDQGGIGILRQTDQSNDLNMALLWYGQHGSDHKLHSALDHGHFDGLQLSFFNRNHEVLEDYGFGRWVNVEPKFGGRYIPENKSYCKQTIAHNTVVVDETSQNNGDTATAEEKWGRLNFFSKTSSLESDSLCSKVDQGMSATISDYYPGLKMERSVLMVNIPEIASPVLIDIFNTTQHSDVNYSQYDYPVHYQGQIVRTDFDMINCSQLNPLGKHNGYQHLWKVASSVFDSSKKSAMVSWLMDDSYYSMTMTVSEQAEVIFARTGANDPDFNLRSEPLFLVRKKSAQSELPPVFVSALETHGKFDEASEVSLEARGKITSIELVYRSPDYLVTKLCLETGNDYFVAVALQQSGNGKFTKDDASHQLNLNDLNLNWTGSFCCQPTNVSK